ncbi:MMPL family transporter, partial [Nocardia thailandica]
MFTRRRSRWVLGVFAALALVLGALGVTLFERVEGGGYTDPDSESSAALRVLAEEFGQAPPNLVLLIGTDRTVDDPEVVQAALGVVAGLQNRDGITGVASYWTTHQDALRSVDGKQALVVATVLGTEREIDDRVAAVADEVAGARPPLDIRAGGHAVLMHETVTQSKSDAVLGESLAFPVTLIALLFVFGGLVAASLPVIVAFVTVLITMGALWLLSTVVDLSVTATNVATLLGLGLAIDYSLLVVNRYRDELAGGRDAAGAVAATLRSAGRTVVFSAVTVAVALAGLLFFPLLAVRSMGYAGILVAGVAATVSLTVLPAALRLLGERVDAGQLVWFLRAPRPASGEGVWGRVATTVMARPIPIGLAVLAVLLLLGTPFLRLTLGFPDERTLPETMNSRQVTEIIARDFADSDQHDLVAVLPDSSYSADGLDAYARALSDLDGVRRVDTATGSYSNGGLVEQPTEASARFRAERAAYLTIVPDATDAYELSQVAAAVRDVRAPTPVLVGGVAAADADAIAAVKAALPWALAFVVLAMLIVLFLLTGSVVLPVLAVALSVLSLSATFGALVWIFQDGHLSGLLGFTVTGNLPATVPVMLFGVAFGLAMDYQVFLLSRIREEYDRTGDTEAAITRGLERTGRVVTAAAVLISLVFLGFLVSDITFMKAFGIGLPLAVLVDATLVRGVLLPAAMKLLGDANWYAPDALRALQERLGLDDGTGPVAGRQVEVRDPLGMLGGGRGTADAADPADRVPGTRPPLPGEHEPPTVRDPLAELDRAAALDAAADRETAGARGGPGPARRGPARAGAR